MFYHLILLCFHRQHNCTFLDNIIVFWLADPDRTPRFEPDHHQEDIPSPIERLVKNEKDRKAKIAAFVEPLAKFHAMDLFNIRYYVS